MTAMDFRGVKIDANQSAVTLGANNSTNNSVTIEGVRQQTRLLLDKINNSGLTSVEKASIEEIVHAVVNELESKNPERSKLDGYLSKLKDLLSITKDATLLWPTVMHWSGAIKALALSLGVSIG